jgi:F420-dependent methylenetetrahydromethanopterin dehydrogenase
VADKSERQAKQALIEQRLTELQEQFPSQFIIVEKPGAAKPWPSYDSTAVEDIVATMSLTGVTPETVVAYEMENEQRGEVLALMTDLQAEAEAEGIEVTLS